MKSEHHSKKRGVYRRVLLHNIIQYSVPELSSVNAQAAQEFIHRLMGIDQGRRGAVIEEQLHERRQEGTRNMEEIMAPSYVGSGIDSGELQAGLTFPLVRESHADIAARRKQRYRKKQRNELVIQ